MKALVVTLVTFFILCSCNIVKSQYVFNKIPIDTTKWVPTDTLFIDFTMDNITDAILIFDKYKALYRPDNVQTPILFYKGNKDGYFEFFRKSEKLVCYPNFEVKGQNNIIVITQKGIRDDRNLYTSFFKFENGELKAIKDVIVTVVEKSKINEDTGDVTTSIVRQDTICNRQENISLDEYDFLKQVDISLKNN